MWKHISENFAISVEALGNVIPREDYCHYFDQTLVLVLYYICVIKIIRGD